VGSSRIAQVRESVFVNYEMMWYGQGVEVPEERYEETQAVILHVPLDVLVEVRRLRLGDGMR